MRRAPAAVAAVAALLLAVAPAGNAAPRQAEPPAPLLRLVGQPATVAPDGTFGALLSVDGAPEATEIAVDIYERADADDLIGLEPPEGAEATFPLVELPPVDPADPDAPRPTGFAIELFARGEANPDPA